MKLTNVRFLAKANINNNKKSNVVRILMVMLVLSLTLISSFAITVSDAVNKYKEDFRARTLEVDPWNKALDEETLENIRKIEHVEDVYIEKGVRDQAFDILEITDQELQDRIEEEEACVQAWSLIGDEKRSVIAGKTLDETPTFSCIIPSLFYPFEVINGDDNNLDYIDGESLIGETITIKAYGNDFDVLYNYVDENGESGNEWEYLPALEYKLEIVGVYYSSPTEAGYYSDIYSSEETSNLMMEMAFEAGGYDLTSGESDVVKWWNTPSLRTHYVLIDDYDNINDVYNSLTGMGIDCADDPELGIKSSIMTISDILSIASVFLFFATALLCIINLIQSTINSLSNRKGEIGLLKAIGYKNKQIFACLYYEQLKITTEGCIIGAVISAVVIAISNLYFANSNYIDRLYAVDWGDYIELLIISILITVIVPLICQMITLNKLTKIQPKDAMKNN